MDLSRSLALLAFAGAVVLPVSPAAAACEVRIDEFAFSPSSKTVTPGTTVQWCWDESGHSVDGDGFDSHQGCQPVCGTEGDTFTHTFSSAGTFDYVCGAHPSMTGKIVVQASTSPTPKPSTKPPTTAPTTKPPATTAPPTRIPTPTPTTAPPTTVAPTTAPTSDAATTPPASPTSPSTSPAALDIDPAPAKPKTGLAIAIGLVFAAAAFGTAGWLLLKGRSGQP